MSDDGGNFMYKLTVDEVEDGLTASTLSVLAIKAPLARRRQRPIMPISGLHRPGTGVALDRRGFPWPASRAAVYATYASRWGHATVAARLYLPAEWADDPHRRKAANVPAHVGFATKPELAIQMLAELHEQGHLPPWLTGDEVYGQNPTLRHWCEHPDHQIGYALGIPRSFTVTLGCGTRMRAGPSPSHRCPGPGHGRAWSGRMAA